jgi:hypothetical protein
MENASTAQASDCSSYSISDSQNTKKSRGGNEDEGSHGSLPFTYSRTHFDIFFKLVNVDILFIFS